VRGRQRGGACAYAGRQCMRAQAAVCGAGCGVVVRHGGGAGRAGAGVAQSKIGRVRREGMEGVAEAQMAQSEALLQRSSEAVSVSRSARRYALLLSAI